MGPSTYAGLVRSVTRQAREGRMLPWLVFYDEGLDRARPQLAGQLTVSGIVGGSASWGQIGYWVDQRLAGRGIIPTAVGDTPAEADQRYRHAQRILLEEARLSLEEPPLPV